MKSTVVVGMSGGVDSSVSALLLKNLGYRVIGLFMKNWEEEGPCPASKDFEDVVRVCETLQIPYYNVNFVQEYRESVFAQFLADYRAGLTPNPDVLCNKEIKFKVFLEKALSLGADFLATGHYCQLSPNGQLLRGRDPDKDQSYFLHAVKREAFQKVLFPIGHLLKSEVRALAREAGLATAEKKDSTGICFIGKRDFRPFLAQFLGTKPGPFKTLSGQIVGQHEGAAFYTLGQRKGMGLGGEGEAWYVVAKDLPSNTVYVERGANHPALFRTELSAQDLTWVDQEPAYPLQCTAKVRYRQTDTPCTLYANGRVVFDEPQRAITPGQSVVFYQGACCLGGGIIKRSDC
ncbi:MAG: tRNA 2-thiouridine(34) synthase MnmA [Verrucomicrobia bacterium]|nr:tRNA 2-thiouridine(34) synthase MnmA [Verrucomicrobiota bacterium]MBU6446848.1 tRNA 2-thiouridine(34) synthase MnmA [Verrucomicrobiota bacterium]MDE3047737.1 tRNA 2-thiouridine(34) synthase MnmA [Verrucomicrobiota bacterium]